MPTVEPRAAVRARWSRRTALPELPCARFGLSPTDSSAVHVCAPTIPSEVRPREDWNALAAVTVAASKVPLGLGAAGSCPALASRHWAALTALPVEPLCTVG